MAQILDFQLPYNELLQYVPQNLRNEAVRGFIENLFDRQMTHDESAPFFGYIGRQSSVPSERVLRIPQPTVERDVNAVIPVLTFDLGAEKYAFTFQDLVNRAKALNIGTDDLVYWYSQSNNYLPPIDIDRFANYFNYYWVGQALPGAPVQSYNPKLLPEYYTIARPTLDSSEKLNVEVATTGLIVRTGSGFNETTFTLTFTSATTFTLTASTLPVGYTSTVLGSLTTPSPSGNDDEIVFRVFPSVGAPLDLLKFHVLRDPIYDSSGTFLGTAGFDAGDTFTITPSFLSSAYTLTFAGTNGVKGKIAAVTSDATYQTIDGVQIHDGMRVLVKDNGSLENGIYVVHATNFVRATDYDGVRIAAGARTFVRGGSQAGTLFTSTSSNTWIGTPSAVSNTSDWQEGNYWVRGDRLSELNLTRASVIQATMPIIEYRDDLELNTRVLNGVPVSVGGTLFQQRKTEFNQLPLFNLYRYDGTHAGVVSSVFFYSPDDTAPLNVTLQKRVRSSSNASADSVFEHGLIASDGALLFYKTDALHTIWTPGFRAAEAVDYVFHGKVKGVISQFTPTTSAIPQSWTLTALSDSTLSIRGSISGLDLSVITVGVPFTNGQFGLTVSRGEIPFVVGETFTFDVDAEQTMTNLQFHGAVKGTIVVPSVSPRTQQQIWVLSALSSTTFSVFGSKAGALPNLSVDVPYTSAEFTCTITSGTQAFDAGDTFTFRVGNLELPRYVTRAADSTIQDFPGGFLADSTGAGAFQVPRTFVHNPYNESSGQIPEGTLYSHFRSILQNQLGTTTRYEFGGSIKGWSEQHTLLATLLMQRDSTPITIIDAAQRQYKNGLAAIATIYKNTIAQNLCTHGVPTSDARVSALLDEILKVRASDVDVRTVLYDTTSGVVGMPPSLVQLGVLPLVTPKYALNTMLNRTVLIHHDGHSSTPYVDSVDFRREVLNSTGTVTVTRSDGTVGSAVGSFTSTPPTNPYRGELWIQPGGTMLAFDVDYDSDPTTGGVTPTLSAGDAWFDRTTRTLRIWSGTAWVSQASYVERFRVIDLAEILNAVALQVEQRLHDAVNPAQRVLSLQPLLTEPNFQLELRRELFSYASLNGLSPLGSDYAPGDAFTWNYSQARIESFPPLNTPTVPARWHNILLAHQATVPGVIPTIRPNEEPFKLLGFSDVGTWLASLTAAQLQRYLPYRTPNELSSMFDGGTVRVVETASWNSPLSGLVVIDGVLLRVGDIVLITNHVVPTLSGAYVASSGLWVRSSLPLIKDTYVTVAEGTRRGTQFALTATSNGTTEPVRFAQIRFWTNELWQDIQALRPTLRLSVDTLRDNLLPPYVALADSRSSNALTTMLPPTGTRNEYEFGDGGPVESFWMNTLEFGYSIARALLRHDPLMFLGFCWGFNWVEVDGILYDGYDLNIPGHKRFRLHGEQIPLVQRSGEFCVLSPTSLGANLNLTLTYDAYEVQSGSRYQNFSVRDSSGRLLGSVREGVVSTLSTTGFVGTVLLEDFGVPFRSGDSFRISTDSTGSNLTWAFVPATSYQYRGFGQTFTHALRESTITTDSYALQAFRGFDVRMGHRAGGLLNTDDLSVRTETATLSRSSYDLLLKKNTHTKNLWAQALRITVQQFGAISTTPKVGYAPATDGADWVLKVEGYNPRYNSISYYELDTSSSFQTFNVLDSSATSLTFKQYVNHAGVRTRELPFVITGLQSVTNFLFGYSQYLQDIGWEFNVSTENNVDAETGRLRTWQLEVEKFLDRCYRGIELEQGHIVNPFMDRIWVRQDTGLLSEFADTSLFDISGHAAVFDIVGEQFASDSVYVIRGNERSMISAAAPMYSVHAQIDEYEHLFIFQNYIEESTKTGLLYDSFSGARAVTYLFDGRRQAGQTFRPEFGGHYILGNSVRRNLQASADGISQYYDANTVFQSERSTQHALSLLGFNTKSYFDDLNIARSTQFNFWRGLVQSKGTNLSIQAFLNNDRFEDARIDEYWAYKVATYGDARQKAFPELRIQVKDTIQQFTQFQFDPVGAELPNFTVIRKYDETRWFALDDLNLDARFSAESVGLFSLTSAIVGELYELPFVADSFVLVGCESVNATTVRATATTLSVLGYGPATPRYNPVKLLNYVSNEVIEEIPLWHPAAGQHTPTALESVNVISPLNPARYNVSTSVSNNNSYDPLRPWGAEELGRVWFDTTNLSYIPYYDEKIFADRSERLSRWGALADFASIDVYEWVQSTVPPTEYNALALQQAGNADLDSSTRAAGEVALQQTYSRDRTWMIRPIAWSRAGVPLEAAHPSFGSPFASRLHRDGSTLYLERGLFSEYGIVEGSRLGEWDDVSVPPKPLSEVRISGQFSKVFEGVSATVVTVSGISASVSLSMLTHTSVVGPLWFTALPQDTSTVLQYDVQNAIAVYSITADIRLIQVDSGATEIARVLDSRTSSASPTATLVAGEVLSVDFPTFGIRATATITVGGSAPFDVLRSLIIAALGSSVTCRDAVQITNVVGVLPTLCSNDSLDALPRWRAWEIPTQTELDADGRQPNSRFKPYVGEFSLIPVLTLETQQDAVLDSKTPRALNDGTKVSRYSTGWSDWAVRKNVKLQRTQTVTGPLTLTHTSPLSAESTSVYLNGIAVLSAGYTLSGSSVTLLSVPAGSIGTVIVRKYEPTAAELAFDPAVADDLTISTQFKKDYEYVSLPVRDIDGALSSTLYYFWVTKRTTAARGKKLSTAAIAQTLRDGPPNYLTLQNPQSNGSGGFYYDAITISGLSFIVAKDDTFKLRFTRNFTLRDDPQELELRNTHTEWSLLRPGQITAIPEALWTKLTDSVAGQDAAGNVIPAMRRVLYDERTGGRSQYGFGPEQTLAPRDLLVSSITSTIVNTKLVNTYLPSVNGVFPTDFITALNFNESSTWFSTPERARETMTTIWRTAKGTQINEIFFAALNDVLASNFTLTDIFKTSRLSAYSVKVVSPPTTTSLYE